MTYKSAVAGLPLGGGKGVIVLRPGEPLDARRRRATRCSTSATPSSASAARYVTAEDVGTSTPRHDASSPRRTPHVTRPLAARRRLGRPEPVHRARRRCRDRGDLRARVRLARRCEGRSVAVVGLGHVGLRVARLLAARAARGSRRRHRPGQARARPSSSARAGSTPAEALTAPVDVLAPCALGGVLDHETVPRLQAPGDRRRGEQPARVRRRRRPAARARRSSGRRTSSPTRAASSTSRSSSSRGGYDPGRANAATPRDRRHAAPDLRRRRAQRRDAAGRGDGAGARATCGSDD